MPYLAEFIDGGKGVVRIGRNVVTGEEILLALRTWDRSLYPLEKITHALVDLTEVSALEITGDELRKIADIDKAVSQEMGPVYLAIAASRDIAFGMSRMYQGLTISTGWKVNIVRERSEAVEWLRSVVDTQLV
jgi:hypothetical protein